MNDVTIIRDAAPYAGYDDCLAACAADVAEEYGLEGWDLEPRWADDERDAILLDVPRALAGDRSVVS